MRNASKFWSIRFMDANFFYCSIYDRFIQTQPGANFFFKNFLETIDCIFYQFHRNVPYIEVKNFFSPFQKNQACGVIQAIKHP